MLAQLRRSYLVYAALSLFAVTACDCGDDETLLKASVESFTASPTTVMPGGKTTLRWTVKDATSVSIVATPGGNVITDRPDATGMVESAAIMQATTFTLTAVGAGGNATATVMVSVTTPGGPVIDTFTATPMTLAAAGVVTLDWTTTNADTVDIVTDGGVSVVTAGPADGTQVVNISATTTYILHAKKGTNEVTNMIVVTVQAGGPVIASFTATPNVIDIGESSVLAWNVTDATTIVVTAPDGTEIYNGANGMTMQTVTPTITTEYTLVATNPNGNNTAMATVSVNPPNGANIGSFSASPSPITLGDSSILSWDVTNADHIEISDGAAIVHSSTTLVGMFTVNPLVDTTYTLTAFNVNGNATAIWLLPVQLGVPLIRAFTATPNPGAIGGQVTLTWDTFAADSVRILLGNTEVLATANNTGTQVITLTTTATVVSLEASNAVGGSTALITLYGQDTPVIAQFDVAPMTFMGTVTTTVTWNVRSVSGLQLFQDGVVVPNFPFTPTTTAAVDSAGTMHIVVNDTTTFTLSASSVAGRVDATQSVYSLLQKTEPNNTASTAIALLGNGSGAAGAISPAGDQDWYSFDVPAGGNVRIELSDGAGGCNFDSLLALTSSTGAPILVTDDDDGIGACSLIDPATDAGATNLAAGSYRARVTGFSAVNTTGSYVIQVTVSGPSCGNGITEIAEQCDDGGNADGDGCSGVCAIEPAGTISVGQDQTFVGTIDPAVQRDFYEVNLAVAGFIYVETFSPLVGECIFGADTAVTLLDSNLTVLGTDNDDGINACSLIDPQFDSFAVVPAGTYYVRVEEFGNNGIIPEYRVRIRVQAQGGCGNGIIETVAGIPEICDDGNTQPGDGCDSACNFEGILEDEAGGNNAYNGPGVVTLAGDVIASGVIQPANDQDWYAVTIAQGQHLDAYATVGSLNSCPSNTRLRVQLYGTNGTTLLADNTTSGPSGTCGRINPAIDADTFNMAAGTYFIRVTEASTPQQALPLYYLHVRVLDPGCGNTIREAGEACDDGNTDNGDGCDAACAFEPLLSFTAPGAQQTFNGSIDPADNLDAIQIVVTAESYLFLQTYTNAATGVCVGADTIVRLMQADGITEIGNDDDNGVGNCSRFIPGQMAFARVPVGTYWVRIEEYQLNNVIPNYDVVISATPVDTCGNNVREAAEQCDDGNTINGDSCDSTCAILPLATYSSPGGPQTISAQSISAVGQIDYVRIDVTATSYLRAETFGNAAAGTCAAPTDTVIAIVNSDGFTARGSDNDDGVDLCSLITPNDTFARLPAGTYYLAIAENGADATIANYDLVVSSFPADVCANGVVEAGEFCDDGNTNNGDGCSSTCTPETPLVFDAFGAPAELAGAITTVGQTVFIRINVTSNVYLRAETFAPTTGVCNGGVDTVIRLYNPQGVEVGSDDEGGLNSCSLIQRSANAFARLTPGPWFLRVEDYLNNGTIPAFVVALSATPADVCGDGIAEYAGGEQCDDTNIVPGDGCSDTCQIEFEGTYTLPGAPITINGAITPATDVDGYQLTVTAETMLRVEAFESAANRTCATADPIIRVLSTTGLVAQDDADGINSCSLLGFPADQGMRLLPGTYYLVIEEDGRNATIANYDLVLTSAAPATCGNGYVEVGEECDDANTANNDGCSSTCTIATFDGTTPNLIWGQIAPIGNQDNYPVTLANGAYLVAETFSPTVGNCNGIDTVLQLIAANGTTVLGEDDEGGVNSCSLINGSLPFARLAAGSYFVRVLDYLNNGTIDPYLLSLRTVPVDICGNGVIEALVSEACDDGNLSGGDGCSPTCQFENPVITEIEPNNTPATATNSTLNGIGTRTVTGAITTGTDTDSFSFQATAGQTVTAQTYGAIGNLTNCSFDSEIFLMDTNGTSQLTSDDESGANSCSLLTFTIPANGTYTIRVEDWTASGSIPLYYMDITLQ